MVNLTENVSWRLVVPFTTSPMLAIREEVRGDIGPHSFVVHPTTPNGGGSSFLIENIPTVDIARDLFDVLRRGAVTASLSVPCGVQIKSTLEVIEDVKGQLPSDPATPYACPQNLSGGRLTLVWGQVSFQAEKVLPRFKDGLMMGLRDDLMSQELEGDLALACKLYVDSFYETSLESRFLTLIGVLEVLKVKAQRSDDAVALIDHWLWELAKFGIDASEKESLAGKLRDLKQVSIGQGIKRTVVKYLDEDRAREAANLYGVRSKLVHNGVVTGNLQESFDKAQDIVRRLLVAMLFGDRVKLG